MSEYQHVAFRAVDGPVSAENLKYMRSQSSRANVTPWSFDNEYHFGDFRGDAKEMLRRGYDIFLHFADFGLRKVMLRLPHGLPLPTAAKPYLNDNLIKTISDSTGPGIVLSIQPHHVPGGYYEFDAEYHAEQLTLVRKELLAGDLRPLYLAHLAILSDGESAEDDAMEAPVPAGLNQLSDAQMAFADFLALDPSIIGAAAQQSPPLPEQAANRADAATWVKQLSTTTKENWLTLLLTNDEPHLVRAELVSRFQEESLKTSWPTVPGCRTVSELRKTAEEVRAEADLKERQRLAAARNKHLAKIAADPKAALREIDQHFAARHYQELARALADLRDAQFGGPHSQNAALYAKKLAVEFKTRKTMIDKLKQQGFLGGTKKEK